MHTFLWMKMQLYIDLLRSVHVKNFWIFIISLSLQVKFVIDGKINYQGEISWEFLLHSYWKKLGWRLTKERYFSKGMVGMWSLSLFHMRNFRGLRKQFQTLQLIYFEANCTWSRREWKENNVNVQPFCKCSIYRNLFVSSIFRKACHCWTAVQMAWG